MLAASCCFDPCWFMRPRTLFQGFSEPLWKMFALFPGVPYDVCFDRMKKLKLKVHPDKIRFNEWVHANVLSEDNPQLSTLFGDWVSSTWSSWMRLCCCWTGLSCMEGAPGPLVWPMEGILQQPPHPLQLVLIGP